MKDGEIVQQGTPEELVLNPATDYVREFTQAVPKAKVVRAENVMVAAEGEATGTVGARTVIADAAPLFLDGAAAVAVTDAGGAVVGHLRRADVTRLLMGG